MCNIYFSRRKFRWCNNVYKMKDVKITVILVRKGPAFGVWGLQLGVRSCSLPFSHYTISLYLRDVQQISHPKVKIITFQLPSFFPIYCLPTSYPSPIRPYPLFCKIETHDTPEPSVQPVFSPIYALLKAQNLPRRMKTTCYRCQNDCFCAFSVLLPYSNSTLLIRLPYPYSRQERIKMCPNLPRRPLQSSKFLI
jgi:hypothetical protein